MLKRVSRFNDTLGYGITVGIGSMWCAYLFAAYSIWQAPATIHALGFANWFTEEFLQLVLLSVIMVGQNVQAKRQAQIHEKVNVLHAAHVARSQDPKGNA